MDNLCTLPTDNNKVWFFSVAQMVKGRLGLGFSLRMLLPATKPLFQRVVVPLESIV